MRAFMGKGPPELALEMFTFVGFHVQNGKRATWISSRDVCGPFVFFCTVVVRSELTIAGFHRHFCGADPGLPPGVLG